MDTQNTQVHIRLWHRDFWFLSIADLLLSTVVYMWLSRVASMLEPLSGMTSLERGGMVGIYGLGLFLLGPYCHYLIQRYRRNKVCILSVAAMALLAFAFGEIVPRTDGTERLVFGLVIMLWYGAFFGLAQMVLSGVLVLDVAESGQRTEANYASAWFRRFAICAGPLLAIVLPVDTTMKVRGIVYLAAIVLLLLVKIPFKTPDGNEKLFSTDRFILSQGHWLAFNLLPVAAVLGMSVAMAFNNPVFFEQVALGFAIALVAEKFVFADADLQSEFISGGFCIIAALLMYVTRSGMPIVEHLAPSLIGIGTGLISSRIQMFFIKLADHCQRGTAQNSFFLSWEFGFALGIFLTGWLRDYHQLDVIGLIIILVSTIFYKAFTHNWYLKHRNR